MCIMYQVIHCSTIYNSRILEAPQKYLDRNRLNTFLYIYNTKKPKKLSRKLFTYKYDCQEILLSEKKKHARECVY